MINAGEYAVANVLRTKDPKADQWVPTRDKGAGFLVSRGKITIARVQVKASRDYVCYGGGDNSLCLKASSWFWAKCTDLENPFIDLWSLVIVSGKSRHECFYLNIPTRQLRKRLIQLYGKQDRYSVYVWLLYDGRAVSGRGVRKA